MECIFLWSCIPELCAEISNFLLLSASHMLFPLVSLKSRCLAGKCCLDLTDLLNMEQVVLVTHCWFRRGHRLLSAFLYLETQIWVSVPLGHWFLRQVSKSFVSLPSFYINLVWLKSAGLGDRVGAEI